MLNLLSSKKYRSQIFTVFGLLILLGSSQANAQSDLSAAVQKDYDKYLKPLFIHFHQNPELSLAEFKTAKRLAKELRSNGFKVTENVGGTGVIAMMENGEGPLVMMRADMDGLPVEEKSGLDYASKAQQKSPITGKMVSVMHACGHDVHITSLVGTARYMAANKDKWSGTLMLLGQPAEERGLGARDMMNDKLWERFGMPDYALAFHVSAGMEAGIINVLDGSPFAGADSVDIDIYGVGAHGASPHKGIDPIVLGSQIVLALQTLVARELSPREPGVVTVGSFHSGSKHNIISDHAKLQLTVRNTNLETREKLLAGIRRIAENMGRVAGLPEDRLPKVSLHDEGVPPTVNDVALAQRLRSVWQRQIGEDQLSAIVPTGMGAEDFPFFTTEPRIPSVYFTIGGTSKYDMEQEEKGLAPVPSHHSPLFKVEPDQSVPRGVEATVLALLELMPVQ